MKLPYAVMCELREIGGDSPSTNFVRIGNKPPSPEAMNWRRAYLRPLSAINFNPNPTAIPDRCETSASLQDLVDFGLIEHGYWYDGHRQTKDYGFHLTVKGVEALLEDQKK